MRRGGAGPYRGGGTRQWLPSLDPVSHLRPDSLSESPLEKIASRYSRSPIAGGGLSREKDKCSLILRRSWFPPWGVVVAICLPLILRELDSLGLGCLPTSKPPNTIVTKTNQPGLSPTYEPEESHSATKQKP